MTIIEPGQLGEKRERYVCAMAPPQVKQTLKGLMQRLRDLI